MTEAERKKRLKMLQTVNQHATPPRWEDVDFLLSEVDRLTNKLLSPEHPLIEVCRKERDAALARAEKVGKERTGWHELHAQDGEQLKAMHRERDAALEQVRVLKEALDLACLWAKATGYGGNDPGFERPDWLVLADKALAATEPDGEKRASGASSGSRN